MFKDPIGREHSGHCSQVVYKYRGHLCIQWVIRKLKVWLFKTGNCLTMAQVWLNIQNHNCNFYSSFTFPTQRRLKRCCWRSVHCLIVVMGSTTVRCVPPIRSCQVTNSNWWPTTSYTGKAESIIKVGWNSCFGNHMFTIGCIFYILQGHLSRVSIPMKTKERCCSLLVFLFTNPISIKTFWC